MNLLITGGTGSFGQALVKYLLDTPTVERYGHKYLYDKIVIYSRDEHKQELMKEKFKSDKLRFLIGDVRDKDRLQLAVDDVDHIVHTAALKIVPSAEYNPFEYVKTNIMGSQNLIECCVKYNIKRKIIALSTDKAVSPLNLYGATKLTMEKLFIAANNIRGQYGPKFSIVRYGNVAGSNGSVIPLFKRMKELGAPMPITDYRMTRFWILLEEAVEFTMNSLAKMQGGETFIPDMPSFKVIDLANCFESQIVDIGIRPGEKLHEEIEVGRSSGDNEVWLTRNDLVTQLKEMGVL